MEGKPKKWEIELKLPKGKTKTFVYSDDGKNIVDRFKPEYECKVLGVMDRRSPTRENESC